MPEENRIDLASDGNNDDGKNLKLSKKMFARANSSILQSENHDI